MTSKPILSLNNITKTFPGVIALHGVSFDLLPGEIHAICGENGAGKSTLIKIIAGIHPYGSYSGELMLNGSPVEFKAIGDSKKNGIGVIYQELALAGDMTVAENIYLGDEPLHYGFIHRSKLYYDAKVLLDSYDIKVDPFITVERLGIGQQQMVEIAKALCKESKVLILDEPTAALTQEEIDNLLSILRELKGKGIACIYISHKLEEVKAISDRITVLRDGETIGTYNTKEISKDQLVKYMVGRDITDYYPKHARPKGRLVLKVNNLSVSEDKVTKAFLKDISFELHEGEVLGIGGLMGSGRTELLLSIFGAWGVKIAGDIIIHDNPISNHAPTESILKGIVLVSEDRRRYGLHLDENIGFNLSLSALGQLYHRFRLMDHVKIEMLNRNFFERLLIKAPTMTTLINTLSGGNQQKVVLGKALMTGPDIILMDEPTRGIDVGAKNEIYKLINALTDEGKAVILVSGELQELMGMSDRIIMLNEGIIRGTFNRSDFDQEMLMSSVLY